MEDIIRAIRKDCRLAMNGVVSASMRDYGLDYKLNFGLMTGQIKVIADKYGSSAELAERLWNENTRELKVLSTMLYPIDQFTEDVADRWVAQISNQEIREQVCLNLFQNLPFAIQLALKWSNNEDAEIRISGYWLMTRLFLTKKINGEISSDSFSEFIWNDIVAEQLFLRNASSAVLKHLVRVSKEEGEKIMKQVAMYQSASEPIKQEAYNGIAFEFQFMYL